MKKIPLRRRMRGFKAKFVYNLKRTSPALLIRLALAILLYLPWLLYSLADSFLNLMRWKKIQTCQEFMRRHSLAFEGVDISTLEVSSKSGGVSNANQIWRCRKSTGEEIEYFVKIFVSVGSFWAKHLSLVSPFPAIYGGQSHERFTVDMISRVQLKERGIAVPRLIAFDPVERVMVTENLHGESVAAVLKEIAQAGSMSAEAEEVIRQCGVGLAKIHQAGFSLIDTQPANCVWVRAEARVYFTDLEFCSREDKRVWDVGFFLCFLAIDLHGELKNMGLRIFLESYQGERHMNLAGVQEVRDQLREYLPIFQAILDIRELTPEELFEELING